MITLPNVLPLFSVGQAIGVYLDALENAGTPTPIGAALETVEVAEDGSLSFDQEADGSSYVLAAQVEVGGQSEWRLLRVTTSAPPEGGGAGGVTSVAGRDGDVILGTVDINGLSAALGEKADKVSIPGKAVVASSGSAYTITAARTTILTLNADCALTLPSAVTGDPVLRIVFIQDDTGGRQAFWPGLAWEGGQAPELQPDPGRMTVVELIALGKDQWLGTVIGSSFSLDRFTRIAENVGGGPVFFAVLDDEGAELVDLTGNAPEGAYVGAPPLVDGSLASSGLEDAASKGHHFVGAKYGSVPHVAELDLTDEFTVFVRLRLLGGEGTSRGIVALGDNGLYIRVNDENEVQIVKQNAGIIAYCGTLPEDGEYHTIIVGIDGEDIVGEIDGDPTLGSIEPAIELEATEDAMLIGTGEAGAEHGNQDQHLTILYDSLLEEGDRRLLHHSAIGVEVRPTLSYSFEDGTIDGWNTGGVGEGPAYPEVSTTRAHTGTHSLEVNLQGEQNRAELVLGGDGSDQADGIRFGEGDHYRWSYYIYIVPGGMVYGLPGAHNVFNQLKSDGEGSPQIALELWDYATHKGLWINDVDPADQSSRNRFLSVISEGEWHQVAIEFIASESEVGMIKVSLDGVVLTTVEEINTIVPGHNFLYLKDGLYRNGATVGGILVDELTGGGPGHIFLDDFLLEPL